MKIRVLGPRKISGRCASCEAERIGIETKSKVKTQAKKSRREQKSQKRAKKSMREQKSQNASKKVKMQAKMSKREQKSQK